MKIEVLQKRYITILCAGIVIIAFAFLYEAFIVKADNHAEKEKNILEEEISEKQTTEEIIDETTTRMQTTEENTDETTEIQTTKETITEKLTKKPAINTKKIIIKIKSNGKEKQYSKVVKKGVAIRLPSTHSEFIKKYPELILKGYIFNGFYKNSRRVTRITSNSELYIRWRKNGTRLRHIAVTKGKVTLKFNNKDWKYVDGIKVMYSSSIKFKKKHTKFFFVSTNRKAAKIYTIKKKAFKDGREYFIRVKFYYRKGNRKIYYKEIRNILGFLYNRR